MSFKRFVFFLGFFSELHALEGPMGPTSNEFPVPRLEADRFIAQLR